MPDLTLSTSSTTSTSSQKYNLSPTCTTPILVYKLRARSTVYMTEADLCRSLDKDPHPWRCSRKPIPRGCSRIDVFVRDLFNEPERTRYRNYPNQDSNIANVGLPRGVWWKRLLLGGYEDLYILSPEGGSREGSKNGTSKGSREHSEDDYNTVESPTERILRGASRQLSSSGD